MRRMVATFLAVDPVASPDILSMPMPPGEGEPPVRILRPIITPDGPQSEVWERVELFLRHHATYRLVRVIPRPRPTRQAES